MQKLSSVIRVIEFIDDNIFHLKDEKKKKKKKIKENKILVKKTKLRQKPN